MTVNIENCYDNSQLAQFQKCPMSYYLQYVKGFRKSIIDDSNAAMYFGSAVHSFLETLFLGKSLQPRTLAEAYVQPEDLPQYSLKALEFVCQKYVEKYKLEDAKFEVLEVEKTSYIDIGKHKFIVKKDGVIKHNDNIFGLEHKTTKSISYNYFSKFFLNSQISAQVQSTIQDYGQCNGILLNAIECKLLKRKPTSSAYDGFMEVPEGFVTVKFQRDYINRTPHEIQDWREQTKQWIDLIEYTRKNDLWLKSTGSWSGIICSSCEYKELCKVSRGLELDESITDCLYEETDPYGYLKQ